MAIDSEKVKEELMDIYKSLDVSDVGNISYYNKNASRYDRVYLGNGCTLHLQLVDLCLKHLPSETDCIKLLDLATGTGLVVQALKYRGFEGVIDGLDSCRKMVDIGNRKQLYRNVVIHQITLDNLLPFPDNTYDAIICCASICVGHIPYECIRDMVRVLAPNGILLFDTSCNELNNANKTESNSLGEVMSKLIEETKCILLEEVCAVKRFDIEDNKVTGYADLFCYKKI